MTESPEDQSHLRKAFAAVFGLFLGLALLKFGTPSVMDRFVTPPTDAMEFAIFVWPLKFAYPLAIGVGIFGLFACRWQRFAPPWLMAMPVLWWAWQLISATQSIDHNLSRDVVAYFSICLLCLFLGGMALRNKAAFPFFFVPVLLGFTAALYVGIEQNFGGLEASRKYFWAEIYPKLPSAPTEYIRKMQSNRIFSTVFYPNAFAGLLLLLTPTILAWIWQAKAQFTIGARSFLCGLIGLTSAACLYWTGSKGGWLLAMTLCIVIFLHQRAPAKLKLVVVASMLLLGIAGFYLKNKTYLDRGATSVVARFDYWTAAYKTTLQRPIFGSGPGTFAIAYQAVKRPESEMARLTHNDYLQQASDSGIPGFLVYITAIGGIIWQLYRKLCWHHDPIGAATWLGLSAWALQSIFEFTLYVPSVAWLAFTLAGWSLQRTMETNRQTVLAAPNLDKR